MSYNKALLSVMLIMVVISIMEQTAKAVITTPARYSYYQLRDKARSPRGFKSERLSTARGFGKRSESMPFNIIRDFSIPAEISEIEHKYDGKSNIPVEWLIEKMQNNPDLTKMFMRTFVDLNQDGKISEDELVSPKINSQKMFAANNDEYIE